MQFRRCGRERLAAIIRSQGFAAPVGDDTASAFNSRFQRGIIGMLKAILRDDVDLAER